MIVLSVAPVLENLCCKLNSSSAGEGMAKVKANTGYVVYCCEHLRDGLEEWANCFDTLKAALNYVNKDFYAKNNMTFRLFKLGEEISLTQEVHEEPQPVKTKTVFRVK